MNRHLLPIRDSFYHTESVSPDRIKRAGIRAKSSPSPWQPITVAPPIPTETCHCGDSRNMPRVPPATLNRLTNGYGRRRNLILLNFPVKSNLNSPGSVLPEGYNISNGQVCL